jgi:hypothetical protein
LRAARLQPWQDGSKEVDGKANRQRDTIRRQERASHHTQHTAVGANLLLEEEVGGDQ